MNTTLRSLEWSLSFSEILRKLTFTWQQLWVAILICAVLGSALSIIYVTNMTRTVCAQYQHSLQEASELKLQRGQLLLEKSAWTTPLFIQQMAEKKNMVMPDHHSVVVLRA